MQLHDMVVGEGSHKGEIVGLNLGVDTYSKH
jgi:hypothetical protein